MQILKQPRDQRRCPFDRQPLTAGNASRYPPNFTVIDMLTGAFRKDSPRRDRAPAPPRPLRTPHSQTSSSDNFPPWEYDSTPPPRPVRTRAPRSGRRRPSGPSGARSHSPPLRSPGAATSLPPPGFFLPQTNHQRFESDGSAGHVQDGLPYRRAGPQEQPDTVRPRVRDSVLAV